jgi:hypothetical protein
MKRALRLVRFYGGGVSLGELLGSSRLMRVASEVQEEELAAFDAARQEQAGDAAFAANVGGFFAEHGLT